MLHWFAKRREGDAKIIGGVGGGGLCRIPVMDFRCLSRVLYLYFFKSRNRNRNHYFSKVGTGTVKNIYGSITLHILEVLVICYSCFCKVMFPVLVLTFE